MDIKNFEELKKMLKELGILTNEDLMLFNSRERQQGENTFQAVKRYYKEVKGE